MLRPLPFAPEPVGALRARHAEAIAGVVDLESYLIGNFVPPSRLRRHVFDHEDGLRLIVSHDACRTFGGVVPFSASVAAGSPPWAEFDAGVRPIAEFLRDWEGRFRALSGDGRPAEFIGFSAEMGFPH